MSTATNVVMDQKQIVHLMDNLASAIRSKNVDGCLANYSKNVSLFDVIEPLQYTGIAAVRERAAQWFASFAGPIAYETQDLRIATDGDVAFSHSLNHVSGTTTDGKKLDMWWRATLCYRKMDDRWLIAHEHNSVPFNPATGQASLELKPTA